MAGKGEGATALRGLTYPPPRMMGGRLTRAYAEGRRDMLGSGTNPHTSGTPEYTAYDDGYQNLGTAADQFETATP